MLGFIPQPNLQICFVQKLYIPRFHYNVALIAEILYNSPRRGNIC